MNILALDLATKTGWAHACGVSGVFDFSIRRDESAGMRLLRFRAKLDDVLACAGVDLVVFEAARHAAPKMQGVLVVQAEMQGVLKEWCEGRGIDYRGFSPTEIKKWATGRGNASKTDVLEAAERTWHAVKIEDHNHADALWLLDLAVSELAPVAKEQPQPLTGEPHVTSLA